MQIDGVFSGGGIKAYAFIGALESIEAYNLNFERIAGTSAGAIIAGFIAANYTVNEIKELLDELDFKQFLDAPKLSKRFPFSKWFFLYFQMGIYKGERLEQWIYRALAAKDIYTFKDIKDGYLKVVISDLTLGKLIIIPDDLERVYGIHPASFPVATAIRMSAGFPYFFMPKKLQGKDMEKSIIVDGGLLSNFPLWIFENDVGPSKRPVLGVKLSSASEKGQQRVIKNAFDMFNALFSTMKQAHDARYISKTKQSNIIFVPVENVDTMDFNIDDVAKEYLIKTGKDSANTFLKYWPK